MEIKGYTYGYGGGPGAYRSERGVKSQELLYEIGVNWVCLAVPVNQQTYYSTEIPFDFKRCASFFDIKAAVERAHSHGVKVCLKPMVNCNDGVWRAQIDFPDSDMMGNDVYWKKWFDSYNAFMLYYAEIAENLGCEMLCIGCEMLGTERKTDYWRELIKKVREVYHGPLVYNTNHGHEEKIQWFDDVDYVGTSAYYPVGRKDGKPCGDVEVMKQNWMKIRDDLAALAGKLGKKIIFMEIGCRSAEECASMPWDFSHRDLSKSDEEQANFYESVLSVMSEEPWFAGFFWWDWSTYIYDTEEDASKDRGFNIHLKKAEDIIKKWYKQ